MQHFTMSFDEKKFFGENLVYRIQQSTNHLEIPLKHTHTHTKICVRAGCDDTKEAF